MFPETRITPEGAPSKFYAEHLKAYEFIKSSAAGKKILEVGCGDGYGLAYLAEVASEAAGVDYEKDIIVKARNKYKKNNLSFFYRDAASLQFEDNTFDIVCSFQVIEHIPEEKLPQYLSEIKRVLKDDGIFYLSTLNLAYVMKSPLTYQKNPAHCKEFRLCELKLLLSRAFPHIEIFGQQLTLKHHFYLRLKKIGISDFLPQNINPVKRFYNQITAKDFKVTANNLSKAISFICVCKK